MSNSFDDRRGRLPPPRPPARPNTQAFQGDEGPRTADPRRLSTRVQQVVRDDTTGPATLDYEPSMRTGRREGPAAPIERLVPDYMSDPNDIEPPVDAALTDAFNETMGRAPEPLRGRPVGSARGIDIAPPDPMQQRAPAPRAEETDLFAPSRTQATANAETPRAAIVPPGSVTGRSLNLVIVIMCFLACLTAGAVYMMNQSAAAWLRDIASEVTVQIEARERTDVEKTVATVTKFLEQQRGIRAVRVLTATENAELLEPWLGQMDALKTLPVPRLIALELDRNAPPDFTVLRSSIAAQFKGVTLDDHRQWQQQIRTVTRSFALGGLTILMLVGAATTAVIVSATRAALAANREIVEVLHFVGATDRFIAREFEKHFLRLGVRAGILGAVAAMLVFLALPFVMELLGGGTVTLAEMRRMIGSGALDWSGYLLLAVVVAVIAALCMLTSRIGVYRILHSQH